MDVARTRRPLYGAKPNETKVAEPHFAVANSTDGGHGRLSLRPKAISGSAWIIRPWSNSRRMHISITGVGGAD